ncbi:MerR family transcriptional regulator [Tepidimonas charontis]|uniref:HTH-type transcriptional repressor BluR n=1 Tax=Tepidimonas charontis TaxID=2267262 RepID=A0A554XK14_9BURK|nr:MerR family transcriptional regulator [Tepidimonas charontis]TSE36165.1 HTH-type transcriptional repressor BluR [Tepidimonas charontis]
MSGSETLPPIPPKRYFTIGEVSELCGVKPHVLRYWEQEFTQLRPMKRRGNRRYYQHHEVLMIRRIRELLYEQGFTIHGARNRLAELVQQDRQLRRGSPLTGSVADVADELDDEPPTQPPDSVPSAATAAITSAASHDDTAAPLDRAALLAELRTIRALLDTLPPRVGV